MPDGEIRHYGTLFGERAYLSSRDGGLSWSIGNVEDQSAFCSGLQLPSGRWNTSFLCRESGWQNGDMSNPPEGATGWMAVL